MSNSASIQSEKTPQSTIDGNSLYFKVPDASAGSDVAVHIRVPPHTQTISILPGDEVEVEPISYALMDLDNQLRSIAWIKPGENVDLASDISEGCVDIPFDSTSIEIHDCCIGYHRRPTGLPTLLGPFVPGQKLEVQTDGWEVNRWRGGVKLGSLGRIGRGDSVLITQGDEQKSLRIPEVIQDGAERITYTSSLGHSEATWRGTRGTDA